MIFLLHLHLNFAKQVRFQWNSERKISCISTKIDSNLELVLTVLIQKISYYISTTILKHTTKFDVEIKTFCNSIKVHENTTKFVVFYGYNLNSVFVQLHHGFAKYINNTTFERFLETKISCNSTKVYDNFMLLVIFTVSTLIICVLF